MSAIFLLVCFSSLKEKLWNLEKCFLFHFKSSFHSRENQILDIQISWRHQIPQHKTRNTFYWITWEANTVLIKFGQFISYCKFLQRIEHNLYWTMKFLKQTIYIRYVIEKLSKFVQISTLTTPDSFLQRIPWKLKKAWN